MFDQTQKTLALEFARSLAARDYAHAYSILSQDAKTQIPPDVMREQYEAMIPLD